MSIIKKKSVLNMNIVMCETNEARKTTLEENIGHISCSLLLFAKDFYVLQNSTGSHQFKIWCYQFVGVSFC